MLEPLRLLMLLTNRMDRYAALLNNAIKRFGEDDNDQLQTKLRVYYADALIEQSLTQQSFDMVKKVELDLNDCHDSKIKALGWQH